MTDEPETRSCGRTKGHPAHRFMLGREVRRCPGSTSQPEEVSNALAAPAQPAERCGDMVESITGAGWYECVLRPGHHGSHADHSDMRWTEIPLPKSPGRRPAVSDGPAEPDNPAATALAQHIADHPVSTMQAAFRLLGMRIDFELSELEP